ncbi:MAG TPA: hypothetical protein VGN14_16800 [Candidatus Elarobacter sp.]
MIRTRSRYGIGCMENVPPGSRPNPEPPPQSYAAADIGKPGFPRLTREELARVRALQRFSRAQHLRIAWVRGERPGFKEFIVFDATDGPCEVWAPGYLVMSGTADTYCNEYYEPGENPYSTHAGPARC